ncbi:M48 family metallopeptidase [uncultured Hymenobacter sp.]|uniref:M48 family metallopeptidase n=1 Tax=uncultured Hymenobacter sp. TaxID=170016 RepID=UPI0035CBA03A
MPFYYVLRCVFYTLLFCVSTGAAVAQDVPYVPFYSPDTIQAYELALAQRNAVRNHLAVPKTGNGEYRDHYKRIVQEASSEVYNSVRYSALLDPVLNAFVQKVFQQVVKANPQLPPTQLVLTKNPEPNARAVGNGTIILNVGLLPTLENESQLAFIICHELAHAQCRHMEAAIAERLTTLHSRELKREVRRIVQAEYNINSKMKALVMGMSLNNSYHQRQHERQADSLGYVLLKRSHYDAPQAYRALQLLDKIDEATSTAQLELARYFSCAEFARKFEAAPAKSQSIFTVQTPQKTALETTDTLKSHPDCAKRMRYVHDLAQGQIAEGPQAVTPEFARLRAISRLEVVQSWFDTDCYDHALFDALLLLREDPQNAYLRSVVQLCLFELRQHLVSHSFNEVVSTVSRHNPENFNQLLNTLYSLRSTDYQELSACFAQTTSTEAGATRNEYTLAAAYAAAALTGNAARAVALQKEYLAHYKSGRFTARLFPSTALKVSPK